MISAEETRPMQKRQQRWSGPPESPPSRQSESPPSRSPRIQENLAAHNEERERRERHHEALLAMRYSEDWVEGYKAGERANTGQGIKTKRLAVLIRGLGLQVEEGIITKRAAEMTIGELEDVLGSRRVNQAVKRLKHWEKTGDWNGKRH